MFDRLFTYEVFVPMGASLNQFFSILFWIIGLLTLAFIAMFAIRIVAGVRDSILRFRKRVFAARR